ncbi:class II aldolase/adducin family protein [Rhizobium paknamense]|uniref:Rhamnose utilization protein RhaD (Predicted bifunctional aldolase and dehydrogenase) n=1 Tax=Rhizobium paknamense TaxID=1206817 RepID=A0ABU0II20_9HYPH|nr:class II aldolase/adducin family protein [Rhizobium paknamense]MDQ0457915.1 rhamnose utilization protein RhaD (predicted bifunctional aldolase and dehydrogenase) [Rhizobium paknamense]
MMRSPEFEALLALSASVGADPLLVQGAGGNTSIKEGGLMWIKASGLWLRQALQRDIMVPVRLDPLLDALERDDPATEKPQGFVDEDANASGLRPSIETTVHALMPQKIVVHVHCVETIAHAVQRGLPHLVAEKLAGLAYAVIPYARPGLPLAKAIAERMRPDTNILVLANHGLVVAGDTVAEAEALLSLVTGRLRLRARQAPVPDLAVLDRMAAGTAYGLPRDERLHDVATDLVSCQLAAGGSLYPDHVVFLGEGVVIAKANENAAALQMRYAEQGMSLPPLLLFPGRGVLVLRDLNEGAYAMARCLCDVTARLEKGAQLRYLTAAENAELLGWDAEKYRQALLRAGQALQ